MQIVILRRAFRPDEEYLSVRSDYAGSSCKRFVVLLQISLLALCNSLAGAFCLLSMKRISFLPRFARQDDNFYLQTLAMGCANFLKFTVGQGTEE